MCCCFFQSKCVVIVSSEIILLWDGMEQGRSLPRVNIENQMILRATASKYGESHDSSENSDFFYCVKKTLLVNYFQKYTFKVPASSHFCEIWESSKYSSINQDGRWNLSKIVHFQHASTERRELAWISYSHSL